MAKTAGGYMSPAALAEYLGVGRTSVYRWIRAGAVKVDRIGFPRRRLAISIAEANRIKAEIESGRSLDDTNQ